VKKSIHFNQFDLKKKYFQGTWYLLLFVFLLWYSLYSFFPGFMDLGVNWQLRQALSQTPFNNHHPAYFSFIWKILIDVFGHYGSMMVFNEVMLWSGLILVVTSFIKNQWLATLFILFLGLGPYYLPYIPHYYKDVPFGASLLLSFGLLLKARDWNKHYLIFIVIYLLFFATSIRHNGFIAIFPICLAIAHILKSKIHFFKHKTNIKGISLFLLICLFSGLINHAITEQRGVWGPVKVIFEFYVVGTSIYANQTVLPEIYKSLDTKPSDWNYFKRHYSPMVNSKFWKERRGAIDSIAAKMDTSEVIKKWCSVIWRHPLSYLKHRLNYYGHFLYPKFRSSQSINRQYIKRVKELYALQKIGAIEFKIHRWYFKNKRNIIKKPAAFLISYLLIMIWFIRRKFKDDPVVIGFTLSGFLYLLSYLFIGADAPFKFIWWSAISLPIICIYILSQYKAPLNNFLNYK